MNLAQGKLRAFIVLQELSRNARRFKSGKYHASLKPNFLSFSWDMFSHKTRLDQWRACENV